jgi:DmsE family decaheme c-type cytochrome
MRSRLTFLENAVRPAGGVKKGSIRGLVAAAAAGFVFLATGFAPPAHASSPASDPAVSALREYVQQIGAAPEAASDDGAVTALRDYAQGLDGYVQLAAGKPVKAAAPIAKAPVTGEAMYVGSAACMTCHGGAAAVAFGQTLMGKIMLKQPRNAQERLGCEGCHGPGSLHVKLGGGKGVGGLVSFRIDDPRFTVEQYNDICMSCHQKGDRTAWRGSTHETRDVGCVNCHTVMRNVTPKFQLAKLSEMDTCFQCHKGKRAEIWRQSHMPVREGKLTCSTCHNPHGSIYGTEALLREATINDGCYKCHAEKRGPFLWEHAPVRENCTNCHDPHGSINDFLLKISRPRLCQQCHANLTGHPGNPRNPFSIYAIGRECQNCHSQHHGSNSASGARFIR